MKLLWTSATIGSCLLASAALAAPDACMRITSQMEQWICESPAVAARDSAMNTLYRTELQSGGTPVRDAQRSWLAKALSCRDQACLRARYDERNATLLRGHAGRRLAAHYRPVHRDEDGDLFVYRQDGWITYDVMQTIIGPGGVAAGDVSAARLSGSARLVGGVAHELKPGGCEILLQLNYNRSWSVSTRHCFDGSRADLNTRFAPL